MIHNNNKKKKDLYFLFVFIYWNDIINGICCFWRPQRWNHSEFPSCSRLPYLSLNIGVYARCSIRNFKGTIKCMYTLKSIKYNNMFMEIVLIIFLVTIFRCIFWGKKRGVIKSIKTDKWVPIYYFSVRKIDQIHAWALSSKY